MKILLDSIRSYTDPRLRVMLFLGFSSGLPLALTASNLFTWLAEVGIDYKTIGIFALVAMPYSLKFLWSPVIDGLRMPLFCRLLGRRRGWLLAIQILLTLAIASFALIRPEDSISVFGLTALVVAFLSASQDIVIDAYRVEILPSKTQGNAAAMYSLGYRSAMLLSGAGALVLSDIISWQSTYLIMAAFMAVGILTCLVMREPEAAQTDMHHPNLKSWLQGSVMAPFQDFMQRAGWLHILVFVVLFKLADAYLGIMFNPFLLDIGFTKTDIAAIVKVYGLVATLFGAFCGGALVARYGMYKTLLVSGIFHMFTNLLLVVQANLGVHHGFLTLCVVTENATAGMSAAAFIAYLSSLCHVRYIATQYALLSSLAAVSRTVISASSGKMAEWLGWQWFFCFASLLAAPSLYLLYYIHKRFGMEKAAA